MAVRIVRIINLISDTPQDHTGVVSVPAHHGPQIFLMPLRKIFIIALMSGRIDIVPCGPLILRILPLVESLVHHQKTHSVTQRIQFRHMWIMAAPDRIAAAFLQQCQSPLPHLRLHCRAQTAAVMVYTDTLDLPVYPI